MLPLDKYLVFLSIVLHTFLPIRLALVTCALVVTLLVSRAQRRMRAVKRKSQKLRVCFLHPDLGIGGAAAGYCAGAQTLSAAARPDRSRSHVAPHGSTRWRLLEFSLDPQCVGIFSCSSCYRL